MNATVAIRPLAAEDLAAYRALRMAALLSHPDAFSASPEMEERMSDAEMMTRVLPPAPGLSLGAFADGRLRGMAAYAPNPSPKMRHKAMMVAVYVEPDLRSTGAGRRLVEAIVAHARSQRVILQCAVAAHNKPARTLYRSLGFEPYGLEKASLMVDGSFIDEEWLAMDLRNGTGPA